LILKGNKMELTTAQKRALNKLSTTTGVTAEAIDEEITVLNALCDKGQAVIRRGRGRPRSDGSDVRFVRVS
jgi:hypothetical protein